MIRFRRLPLAISIFEPSFIFAIFAFFRHLMLMALSPRRRHAAATPMPPLFRDADLSLQSFRIDAIFDYFRYRQDFSFSLPIFRHIA
jgi:hypothetical protein